jgi:hypothetical protein
VQTHFQKERGGVNKYSRDWKNINHRRGKEHQFCLATARFDFNLYNKYLNNMGYGSIAMNLMHW